MNPTPVTDLRPTDIGDRIIAAPRGDDGPIHVEGVVRGVAFTADQVVITVEDVHGCEVEWTFGHDETVLIGG